MIREIVLIDEERCDGCGQCVPACAEGALRIVNGKARLVSDRLCDGLGACLGECPQDAIRVVRREADAFDEAAVAAVADRAPGTPVHQGGVGQAVGCPGSRLMQFEPPRSPAASEPAPSTGGEGEPRRSELGHWPVQLRLVPPSAPMFRGARLLISADCVPVAYAEFQREMLRGRAVVIACPKLDETDGYLEKLTEILRANEPTEVMVARMEVPCCAGLMMLALEARRRCGKAVPIAEVVVGTRGEIIARREAPVEAA